MFIHVWICRTQIFNACINYCNNTNENIQFVTQNSVKLQNLSWYKTGFVSRQVLHLLSKLQNWICPKTGQYKTFIISNTKIEASIRATTKPKPWQPHLTSETVEIFIQNEKTGLVSMQSRFWCGRFRVGAKPVWSGRFRDGTKSKIGFVPMLNLPHQNRLCAVPKPAAPKPALRLC